MNSIKGKMVEIINDQPDDSTYEEILRELAFDKMIEKGLVDSENNRTISNEEMGKRIRLWLLSGKAPAKLLKSSPKLLWLPFVMAILFCVRAQPNCSVSKFARVSLKATLPPGALYSPIILPKA